MVLITVVACVDPAAPAAAPAELIRAAALQPGDELRVRLHSWGCFHDILTSFVITPTPGGGARVHAEVLPLNAVRPLIEPKRDTVLNASGLAALDSVLAYYRVSHSHGCTTTDGDDVRNERYFDASCEWFNATGLTLRAFAPRLRFGPKAA